MKEFPAADFIVLGLDIIKYSEKDLLGQKLAQEKVDRCFNTALELKWPERKKPFWADAGDGGFALFQGSEHDVLQVLEEFYLRLDRENSLIGDRKDKILVRAAIHKDQVIVWETRIGDKKARKHTGHAINNCARLMGGMIKDHDCQVVCSRPVLDTLMAMDKKVTSTRLKDITDKHGHVHEVWNLQRTGLGVRPLSHELYEEPAMRVHPKDPG